MGSHAQVAPNGDQEKARAARMANIGRGDPKAPQVVPGEMLVKLAPGMDANALAAHFGVRVKRQLRHARNTYLLEGVQGNLEQAAGALVRVPGVLQASPNQLRRSHAIAPIDANDTLRSRQWHLRSAGIQDAWGISVGQRLAGGPVRDVVVGLIDEGCDITHPDLAENVDPRSFDFTLDQPLDPADVPFTEQHGTSMAGAIAAVTNNSEGLASGPWEGVTVLACRASAGGGFISTAAEIEAINYCIDEGVDVISMSFGGFLPDAMEEQALNDAYDAGIVLVAAAGNGRVGNFSFGVNYPAAYPVVMAISATGPSGELAFYSDTGPEIWLAAPGGNDSTGLTPTSQIVGLNSSPFNSGQFFGLPPGYDYGQGTSPACAHVSGIVAVLITQGALEGLAGPERVERMKLILARTASNAAGVRTVNFGFGIVNLARALAEFASFIDLISPAPNTITESFSEPVVVVIRRIHLEDADTGVPGDYVRMPVPLFFGDFEVLRDGLDVTGDAEVEEDTGVVEYRPDFNTRYNIGINQIEVSVFDDEDPGNPDLVRSLSGPAEGRIPARSVVFAVRPRVENPGLKMFAVPYVLQQSDEVDASSVRFLFGGNLIRLARFLPDGNRYAIWEINGQQDPAADLTTTDAGVPTPPLGIGFFARVVAPTQVQLLGESAKTGTYPIPLKPGFNMVGNPYPFRVAWAVCSVRFGQEVLNVQEAANRNLMRNVLWRFQDGRYTFAALPNGQLYEWEASWVRANTNLTLFIPRIPSLLGPTGASARSGSALASLGDGWKAGIRVHSKGRLAGEVFVGQASRARDGFGPEDVETPPPGPGSLDLRIRNANWGRNSGVYAQDIRRAGRGEQRWNVEIETSSPGTPVKLEWDRFPAGSQAYLKLEGESRMRSLTGGGAVAFKSRTAGVQRATVIVTPTRGA
jgi:hypothetical protein